MKVIDIGGVKLLELDPNRNYLVIVPTFVDRDDLLSTNLGKFKNVCIIVADKVSDIKEA